MSRRTRRLRTRDTAQRDANTAYEQGRFSDAVTICLRAIETQPDSLEILEIGARAAVQSSELPHARTFLERLAHLTPNDVGVTLSLAGVYQALEELEKAETAYRQVVDADPTIAEAENGLGCVYDSIDRAQDAVEAFRRALKLDPDHEGARRNLIGSLNRLRRLEEEEQELRQLLARAPDDHQARTRLANVLQDQGDLNQAESQLRRILEHDPEHPTAHVMLGVVMFLKNRLADGWAHYHWRRHQTDHPARPFPQKEWSGEPLEGKTVLVWGEQGVGDEVMFASMFPDLIGTGAHVIVECDERLVPLFARSFPAVECISRQDPPHPQALSDEIDFQVSSCNLGPVFRSDFEAFPRPRPFLSAETSQRDALRSKYLSGGDDRLVGIAWKSANPIIGRDKSSGLSVFEPLFRIPGLRFVDLQYGDTVEERSEFADRTEHHLIHDDSVDSLADMDTFAAQVAAMDMVISVSNAAVHVAGALGVPTRVLLPATPMWRWFLNRDDSPWYSSVRLFRQNSRDDWTALMVRVAEHLRAEVTP